MNLTVLVDNNTILDEYYIGEHGLSFYIEDNDKKILFDLGYSNVLLENMKKLNILTVIHLFIKNYHIQINLLGLFMVALNIVLVKLITFSLQ